MTSRVPRRVGILVPAGNRVLASELAQLRPRGVQFELAHFNYPATNSQPFCDSLVRCAAQPLSQLRAWGAEQVLLGCTTGAMQAGQTHLDALSASAGAPVLSVAHALDEALGRLGAKCVAVATPYGESNNRIVADYLQRTGVRVLDIKGLDLDRSASIWAASDPEVTGERLRELALSMNSPQLDAFLFPCTGVPSLHTVSWLEQRTEKLALSAVQVGFWASLRRLGLDGRQSGAGKLLQWWD